MCILSGFAFGGTDIFKLIKNVKDFFKSEKIEIFEF